ncbi:Protein argonaute 1B [Hordeum vulgare]|nr:Protein argonaute 1B [Hordeum vulgare]
MLFLFVDVDDVLDASSKLGVKAMPTFFLIKGKEIVNPYNEDPYAKEFGVTFENRLTIIKGRVLPSPMLKFGDQGKEKKMVDGVAVNTWTCINLASDITHVAAVASCDERSCSALSFPVHVWLCCLDCAMQKTWLHLSLRNCLLLVQAKKGSAVVDSLKRFVVDSLKRFGLKPFLLLQE